MEKLVRDSYGKVGYINMPYENTGSTCNTRTEQTDDVKLHDKLQNISNILDELYKD
ncbi:CJH_07325 family protein, partial [Campylobacter jejuni]|nr:CJH_07325 family protein [Campylobacter jejuni]